MAEKNIQMQRKNADGTFDLHYPITKVENVAGAARDDDLVAHKADYVRQAGYATTDGTATAYTVILDPAPENIVEGFGITIVPHVDCGANPTLNVNGKGAIPLRSNDGDPLGVGDLLGGVPYNLRKVGANFIASSGGGVKINGVTEEAATFSEAIPKGSPVAVSNVFNFETHTKLPDVVVSASTNNTTGAALSPEGDHFAIGNYGSPYLIIYKRDGDTFSRIPNPSVLPATAVEHIAYSPDGVYLAVSQTTAPYILFYKRVGDSYTKLANPGTNPPAEARRMSFSPCGEYLAAAHQYSPFVTIYKRNGDTFTKLANPSALPTGDGNGAGFSHDGLHLAVAHTTYPCITIYKRNGDAFSKLPNPSNTPSVAGLSPRFSPDDEHLAIWQSGAPLLTVYKRVDDTFTQISNPPDLPGAISGIDFSPNGDYFAIGSVVSPRVFLYRRAGDAFSKRPDLNPLPGSHGSNMKFTPNSSHLMVISSGEKTFFIYKGVLAGAIAKPTGSVNEVRRADRAGYALESGSIGQSKKVAIMFK